MALPIVVVVLIVVGVVWRARTTRRLTIEESVDRYRRTLSAVHEASARSLTNDGKESSASRYEPPRFDRGPRSRRTLVVAVMVAITVVAVGAVYAGSRGTSESDRVSGTTTTRPPATHPQSTSTTTTTQAGPTTTVALVRATGPSGTAFTVAKASYTLAIEATTGACWVDARDPEGKTLYSGTLSTGQSQSITAGTVTVRLGNPAAVTVAVEGTPVPFTIAPGSTVTLQFQGTGTAT